MSEVIRNSMLTASPWCALSPRGENGGVDQTKTVTAPRRGPPRSRAEYRALVDAAAARGVTMKLPATALRQLIDRGIRLDAKAHTVIYRDGDPAMVLLVVHGML